MLFAIKCILIMALAVAAILTITYLIARRTQDGKIAHALHMDIKEGWRDEW